MKFGVVIFPGSNCDRDIIHVLQNVLGQEVEEIWHKTENLNNFSKEDCIVLPGGFSYGDYLRTGAIARFSPIMKEVIEHGENGGKMIGICNGFQILCESNLLPGALLRNNNQQFICKNTFLKTSSTKSILSSNLEENEILKIPIAHAEGRFFATEEELHKIEQNNQVVFRYCDINGDVSSDSNPNGSLNNIAGIRSENGNIVGMMPHPERAAEDDLGNRDGRKILESLLTFATHEN